MTIRNGFEGQGISGIATLLVMFAAWFVLSVAILIVMEGLLLQPSTLLLLLLIVFAVTLHPYCRHFGCNGRFVRPSH